MENLTPKERAAQLVEYFDSQLPSEGTTTGRTPIELAKFMVDEFIKEADSPRLKKFDVFQKAGYLMYWSDVKEQLLKM